MPRGPGNVEEKHAAGDARFCMQWRAKKAKIVKSARGGCQMENCSLELIINNSADRFPIDNPLWHF